MDEREAWNCFVRTGRVQDYLVYSQFRTMKNESREQKGDFPGEETDADRNGRIGDWGKKYWGE